MEQIIIWKSPKILALVGVSLLLLFGLLLLGNYVRSPVNFPDANLERVVREKINKRSGDIYRNDLMGVIELDASGRDIQNLEGMQALRRLVTLNLADNKIDDLRPLSRLGMLRELDLTNNRVVDLQAAGFDELSNLSLRDLRLRNNIGSDGVRLSDVSLLSGMTDLERLGLRDNWIEDIGPLAGLNKLQALDLCNNQIREIEALAELTELRELNLRDNDISDIATLAELKKLRELNLRDNLIIDIEVLGGLTNLTNLNLHSNPVATGVEILGELELLQSLIMRNVYIGDAYPIFRNLTQLQRLNIRNSGITDVSVFGELMAGGALQDDPETETTAVIDLLEIEPDGNGKDPYLSLRRYWDNISLRYPLSLPYYPSPVKLPVFSHEAGFYEEEFLLTLTTDEPDGRIFYTLDGSEPALTPYLLPMGTTQEYSAPILIRDRTSEPNRVSIIETGKLYDQHIPEANVFKISNVRGIVLGNNEQKSNIKTKTYLIKEFINNKYSFPILAIVANDEYLFDEQIGIYTPGDLFNTFLEDGHRDANFAQRGLKWERPGSIELFSSSGDLLVSNNLGLRIHGSFTRAFNQKSLRILPSLNYDQSGYITYNLFPSIDNRFSDSFTNTFESLIVRNGGNDWLITFFRDAMAQSLLETTNLDIQGNYPVLVFINGEYWGIHNVRTRYDSHYFQTYHDVSPEELLFIERNHDDLNFHIRHGNDEAIEKFIIILNTIDPEYSINDYVTSNRLEDPVNYHELLKIIDIENYIDYISANIFLNTTDWLSNNLYVWKTTNGDNNEDKEKYDKWRWMIIDLDSSFINPSNNSIKDVISLTWRGSPWSTFLIRSLFVNNEFQLAFINRIADHMNTIFHEETVLERLNDYVLIYNPEIEESIHRWGNLGGSYEKWLEEVEKLKEFALLRPAYQREHIIEYFNLEGSVNLILQTEPNMGYIRINSLDIIEGEVGVKDPAYWKGIYFMGVPIELTAVANEGFKFVRWEGLENLMVYEDSENIIIEFFEDTEITAIFEQE